MTFLRAFLFPEESSSGYSVPYYHSLFSPLLELPEGYVHETRLSNVQSSLAFFSIHRTCKPTFFMFGLPTGIVAIRILTKLTVNQ